MLSFLLLNLVVNADFLSNNILSISENGGVMAQLAAQGKALSSWQGISSELHKKTMNYRPHHVRRLGSTKWNTKDPCMWTDEDKTCHVSLNFMKLTADNEGNQHMKRYVESEQNCLDKDQASCTGDCEFNHNATVCHLNGEKRAKLGHAMMKDKLKNCGPMFASMTDECNPHSQSECSGECQWKESVSFEVDDAEEMCVEVVEAKCAKKLADHPFMEHIKTTCPDMDAITTECAAKEDPAEKLKCFEAKCPMLLMMHGHMGCVSFITKEKCASVGQVCSWKETDNKCEMSQAYLLDLLIPDGCIMKDMTKESQKCSKVETADACTGACKWRTEHKCERKGAPDKEEGCHSTFDVMNTILGKDYNDQHNDCRKATDSSECAGVEQVKLTKPASSAVSTMSYATLTAFMGLIVMQ